MTGRERDSRSMSQDYAEDSDDESRHADAKADGSAPGKPGRKKNPNSAAARRDQNRIAQREFRLRKQQRIRDLEARVEILSGSKDETFTELRNVVRDLMQENQNLRNLIRNLGNYIGEGIGGILPSLGFERPQEFVDFINRAETDTAFEGFTRRKKSGQGLNSTSSSSASISKKRTLDEDDFSRKRAKGPDSEHTGNGASKDHTDDRYTPLLVPISPATGVGNQYYSPVGRSQDVGLFSELLAGQSTSSAMYMTGPAPDGPNHYSSTSVSSGPQFPPAYHPPINVPSGLSSQPFMGNPGMPTASVGPNPTPPSTANAVTDNTDRDERVLDPKMQEATKLIHYHLDNYKRNNAYCLPQSLRPTLVQRTVPHESVIDGIPHPELRDRMILLRGRFDLVECLHDYGQSLALHGDDVLAHSNWEIGEPWLRRFGFLVDQPVLNICNRWRRERGESELTMADITRNSQSDIPTNS